MEGRQMALLERVAMLLRANLNDLLDQAENPEKLLKQMILDMQNQLVQVKTQVALAITDQHLLQKKKQEHEELSAEWRRKAELAVSKRHDDVARTALERSVSARRATESFSQQLEDQAVQVENLKSALRKLEAKLAEAQSRAEILLAQHRRARAVERAAEAGLLAGEGQRQVALDRLQNKVQMADSVSHARTALMGTSVEDRLAALERDEEIDRLLAELKAGKLAS
jgi:phage shock protein A